VREYSPNPDQVFYFLGDVGSSNITDFKAKTFAVSSQCEPISTKCGLNAIGETDERFNCTPPAFSLGQVRWGVSAMTALEVLWEFGVLKMPA
jgi:hypothetical protein